MGDCLICAHHHNTGTIRYKSMPLEREIGFALEYSGRTGENMPDAFVTSHVHWGYGAWMEDGVKRQLEIPIGDN